MILYQYRPYSFFLRLLGVLLSGGLIALYVVGGLFTSLFYFFAVSNNDPTAFKMTWAVLIFFLVAVLIFAYIQLAIVYQIITLLEKIPEGLRVQWVRFDTVQEDTLPAELLDMELETITGKGYSVSYVFKVRNRKTGWSIIVKDKKQIGGILKGIYDSKLIELRSNEIAFLNDFLSQADSKNLPLIFKLGLVVILIALAFYFLKDEFLDFIKAL